MALDPIKEKPVEKIFLNAHAGDRGIRFFDAFLWCRGMGRTGSVDDWPD